MQGNNHINENSIGKTLLVVNTGSIKKKLTLQRIRKMGLTIIVLNKEKNWAQPYIDHWILADTSNHQEAIEEIKIFLNNNPQIKLDGAITFWEDDVLLTSKITDKFGLIGTPYRVAQKARNKYLFREFCVKNNIQTPKFKLVKTGTDLKFVASNFTFPLVIKPVYGSSSAFVIKVQDEEELKDTYSYIKNNISVNAESALSDGLEVYVEEYIDGNEVDINMLIQNGKIKFYSITDNYKSNEPFFIETGMSIPSSLPDRNQLELVELAEETLEKLGIQNACVHFEAKSTKNGAIPIEVNLRMGGDETYPFTKGAWGVDLIEDAVKIALGEYLKIRKSELPKKYYTSKDFLAVDSGILIELDINEDIRKNKYLEEFYFFNKIGDPILAPPEGYQYLGWVAVSGENLLDAQDNLKDALKYINYKVVKFDPASSIGKTARKNRFASASLSKNMLMRAAKFENIRRVTDENIKKLHVGIACNIYDNTSGSEIEQDLMSVGKNIEKTLKKKGYKITFFDFNNLPKTFNEMRNSDVDIVFNVCERINDSSLLEPHAASILDTLQVPYTGSNPFTLALCIDKIRVKKLLTYHDIPTPKWDYAYSMDDEIDDDLKYPLIVKPGNTDNSIGITNDSVVTDKKELKKQLEKIIVKLGRPALVEEYIEGDEYDVTIIGSEEDDLRVLPLSRSIFKNMPKGYWHIYPYNAKWSGDNVYKKIQVQRPPKNISKRLEALISEIALDTYNILDCHDYGRVEIRVDKNNNPYVLELNPNPSINIGDAVPAAAELIGMDYADFIEEIIKMTIKRYKNKPHYYHLQPAII